MTLFGTNIVSLLSVDKICNLIKYSCQCAHLPGYIAEFGVFRGGSLELLSKFNPGKDIIGLDSFSGVPAGTEHDYHQEGDFGGIDSRAIIGYFNTVYPAVRIVKGFLPKAFEYFDTHTRFCFTHIDLDMYESIYNCLDFVVPRTVEGGMILLDDYKENSTPGCKKAIEDFFKNFNPDVSYHGEVMLYDSEKSKSCKQYLIVK